MTTAADLHEMTQELMGALQSETKELEAMMEIGAGLEKQREIREEQERQIKKDIQALIASKTEAEENALIGQSEVTYHNELQQVTNQLESAKAHKENVAKECAEVKGQLDTAKAEQERLQEHREKVKQDTTQKLPNLRYDVSLYSNISNIRWQYDCEPSVVKGYVCNKHDVKPFSLDSKEHSQYFITNYLWDCMEVDW